MENASEYALKWFTNKWMIINLSKLQSIIIESSKGKINPQSLKWTTILGKPQTVWSF